MPSITTWRRLEPRTRTDALTSLAARVADPLWMLARQWQSGELNGSDAGSPVQVRISPESTPVTRFRAEGHQATAAQDGDLVELLVDAITPIIALADRARAGRLFLRWLGPELATRYADGFRDAFMLGELGVSDEVDEVGLRWSQSLAWRGVDGKELRDALGAADAPTLPPSPVIAAADTSAVLRVASRFAAWWDARYAPRLDAWGDSWNAGQLATPFVLGVSTSAGARELDAPEHRGGRLDWHSFDLVYGGIADLDPPSAPTPGPLTPLPTRVGLTGMPVSRWWEFEDAAVDLGRLDAAPDDLGRLLFAEFALVYGGDFFVVPLVVPVGSLTRIRSLVVETNFGEELEIPSTMHSDGPKPPWEPHRRWRMFNLEDGSTVSDVPSGLFVPPAAVDVMEGEACEDVLLTRDEMANVGWAIERKVVGPWGTPVQRREVEYAQQRRADDRPVATDELHYRLSTSVPASWLPLVPTPDGQLHLNVEEGRWPQSQLLRNGTDFYVEGPELPSTGRRVTLHARRARKADGTTALWWTHRVRPGRGESTSGLRFDELTHDQPI